MVEILEERRKKALKVIIRNDSVHIEGYVNAVERNSKLLHSRLGNFIERIRKGAFGKALERNDDVKILLNHNPDRVLGSQKQGNLILTEDPIGLRAEADITDPEVIKDAKNGDLVGWSFGFRDVPDGVEEKIEDGIRTRLVSDLDLDEVSILNREKTPAYDGTLIMARSEDVVYFSNSDDCEMIREDESKTEKVEDKEIDYSEAEKMIKEMKGE